MNPLLLQTRRHFFGQCAPGIGAAALTALFNEGRAADDGTVVHRLASAGNSRYNRRGRGC